MSKERIFCIGLPRTGTHSVLKALDILGAGPTLHGTQLSDANRNRLLTGDFSLESKGLREAQAFADIPFCTFFRELYDAHPGARFILTVRPIWTWLKSIEKHYAQPRRTSAPSRMLQDHGQDFRTSSVNARSTDDRLLSLRLAQFGMCTFHKRRFQRVFEEHLINARKHLPHVRLLILGLWAANPWIDLCRFLRVPEPSRPFPHLNKGPG